MIKKFIFVLFMTVVLSGCATTSPTPTIKYYEQHEASQWLKESAVKFRSHETDFPDIAYRRMLIRVFTWNDSPNAFVTFDDRYIVISISDSLLPYLTDNNIFCLLAHECAHVEFNHQGKQEGLSQLISAAFIVVDAAVPNQGIGSFEPLTNSIIVNAYSRKDELEADTRAIDYLAEMGISNKEYVVFLKLVKSISSLSRQGGGLLDTHPNYDERINNAEKKEVVIKLGETEPQSFEENNSKKIADSFELKRKEIKNRFPFDIGPYGEAKAVKLKQGLTEQDVKTLFDGDNPDEKKLLNKEKTTWAYNIPGTRYRFFILFVKDGMVFRVKDFTINSIDTQLDEAMFENGSR